MGRIIEITDMTSPFLDPYARLRESQLYHLYEPEEGIFIAESPKVIERALDGGYEPVSLLAERKQLETDMETRRIVSRCGDVPVYTAELSVLAGLTGFLLTKGLLCAMRRRPLPGPEEILAGARRIAVLEKVVNPTNLGAMFRSAAALGMDGVVLTHGCADPLYRRAIRVSMGTVFQIPWTFFPEYEAEVKMWKGAAGIGQMTKDGKEAGGLPVQKKSSGMGLDGESEGGGKDGRGKALRREFWPEAGLSYLKKQGFRTAAMALTGRSLRIDDCDLVNAEKLALVFGNEGDGLREATISGCDDAVKIPMSHGVDSLNVAAASAVAFWIFGNRE
mgnify:FL=1